MKIFFGILFSAYITVAQVNKPEDRITNSLNNIFNGFTETLEWYDLPIGVIYLSRTSIEQSSIGGMISAPPAPYEMRMVNSIGRNTHSSLGSMDKDILPNTVFLGRLGINFLLDVFTEREITSEPYREAFLFEKSILYTYTLTELTKAVVHRKRPDNSDNKSFFSGHASTTFAASTYLFLELNEIYESTDWISENKLTLRLFQGVSFAGLYGWAGYVGYSRIKDNKHYLSDVMVGAAAGSLISYLVFSHFHGSKNKPDNIRLYSFKDSFLLSFSMKF